MEGVEELVIVVDSQVDGPRPGLDDGLQIFEHVDVRVRSQLKRQFKNESFYIFHSKCSVANIITIKLRALV